MYFRSPFPPLPPLPATNYHNVIWRGPGHEEIPDHVMQIDAVTGQKRSRAEFIQRMYDGATALGASHQAGGLGLTPDDMVGILSDNCLDYIVLVHSLLVITTPFALFSTYATPREMAHSLAKSKATHMFVHASLLPRFLPVAREHSLSEDRIYILEGKSDTGTKFLSFGELIQRVHYNRIPRVPIREAGKNALAYLVFSSGTSGLPKAVMISHGNLIFSLIQGAIFFQKLGESTPSEDAPIVLSFLPFFHSYSLHSTILRPPATQITSVVMPRWDVDLALRVIPRYRVTSLQLIPSIIHQLANSPQFARVDLSSVVSVASGAAYLPPILTEKFKSVVSAKASVLEGYGMSEATVGIILRVLPSASEVDPGSELATFALGSLLPGLEGMILREDGTHCLPGEPGELYVKGGNISLGYWNNPQATKETFLENGWLKTGDIFKANADGTISFEDRGKDTLKVSGMQVSPAEIEDVLLAEPSGLVNDVAVAGVQTAGARTSDDHVPRAWVVLSERGRQIRPAEAQFILEKWAHANLSKYKWLRGGIQFVQAIPKNATGKVLRRVLQDQYASSHAKL